MAISNVQGEAVYHVQLLKNIASFIFLGQVNLVLIKGARITALEIKNHSLYTVHVAAQHKYVPDSPQYIFHQ